MKLLAIAAASGLTLFSSPALAQDNTETDLGGLYVGAIGGLDVISFEDSVDDDRETGVVYGISAGYDIDTGAAVIGIEGEISDTSISDDFGGAGTDIYGGLRVGLQVNTGDLVYLKAGYSNLNVDFFDNLDGVRLGAGYEKTIDNVFGRIEYRYTTYDVSDTFGADINGNRNQIVFGAGLKF